MTMVEIEKILLLLRSLAIITIVFVVWHHYCIVLFIFNTMEKERILEV